MSELKVRHAYTLDEIEVLGNCAEGNEYYLKSEADKVISDLLNESDVYKANILSIKDES